MTGFATWRCMRCNATGAGRWEELSAHRAQCSGPAIEDEEGRVRARVATLEAELALARKGFDPGSPSEAQIKALEQHVSDLEKSLENARKERDAVRDVATTRISLLEDVLAVMTKERDAALADNAALVEALGDISTRCETRDLRGTAPSQQTLDAQRTVIEGVWQAARDTAAQPHPGAALLEEVAKLRAADLQYKADLHEIHKVLMWAGEWPLVMPQPSRALRALLAHLSAAEKTLSELADMVRAHMAKRRRESH